MFEVGKRVICIETHSNAHENGVIKGKIFTVKAITSKRCRCGVQLDIGINSHINIPIGAKGICPVCKSWVINDDVWWLRTKWFAPLSDMQTELSETTVESILEPELENV